MVSNEKSLQATNDLFQTTRIWGMFVAMLKIQMETDEGKEFVATLEAGITDVIKPNLYLLRNELRGYLPPVEPIKPDQ